VWSSRSRCPTKAAPRAWWCRRWHQPAPQGSIGTSPVPVATGQTRATLTRGPCNRRARPVTAARPSQGACCGMRRPLCSVLPDAVRCEGPPVGLRYDGNDPMALPPTRCPRARVQGAEQDGVALVVPGGAGIEARFHVVRGGDVGRRSPCKRQRNLRWLRCKAVVVGPRRLPRRSAPDRDTETDADTAKTI
jgi:hypothetical protein